MKKLLMFAGILTLSAMAFGVTNDWESGIVDVKAKVVQPLKLETSPLDYGLMIQGETKGWGERSGLVTLTGTPGELVKFEVAVTENNYVAYQNSKQEFAVELATGAGTAENEKMTAKVTLFTQGDSGSDYAGGNGVIKLPTTGNEEIGPGEVHFAVNGPLTAAVNQQPGTYTGKIYVRAMYQ